MLFVSSYHPAWFRSSEASLFDTIGFTYQVRRSSSQPTDAGTIFHSLESNLTFLISFFASLPKCYCFLIIVFFVHRVPSFQLIKCKIEGKEQTPLLYNILSPLSCWLLHIGFSQKENVKDKDNGKHNVLVETRKAYVLNLGSSDLWYWPE